MPLVALTFDDGPRNSTTGRLLEGLALREVPATFFLLGSRIAGSEELIREMAADGHQIGVHTFDHVVVADLSRADFDLQVGKTRALLASILGPGEFWLRPPYGIVDASVRRWSDGPLILWSVDPEDWAKLSPEAVVQAALKEAGPNDIVLLHDFFSDSVDAALEIVDTLQAEGYYFVTVEELLALNGITPQPGVMYREIAG